MVVMQLMRDSLTNVLHPLPLWERHDLPADLIVPEFQREARVVRKAVTGDLTKVFLLASVYTYGWSLSLFCLETLH